MRELRPTDWSHMKNSCKALQDHFNEESNSVLDEIDITFNSFEEELSSCGNYSILAVGMIYTSLFLISFSIIILIHFLSSITFNSVLDEIDIMFNSFDEELSFCENYPILTVVFHFY